MIDEELILALTGMLEKKDERIKELTDLLLRQAGIGDQVYVAPDSTVRSPIQMGKGSNWHKRKAMLEKRFSNVESLEDADHDDSDEINENLDEAI